MTTHANAPAEPKREVGLNEAMAIATNHWQANRREEAAAIGRQILAIRPQHQGARHLMMALDSGMAAGGLIFTAIVSHDPDVHDIGDYSYGVPIVRLHNQPHQPARFKVGRYCTLGHGIEVIMGAYHRQDWYTIYPFSAPQFGTLFPLPEPIPEFSATRGNVTIGNDVWIGAHSLILSGVTIGDGAVVGGGAVVSKDIGPYEIWAGNPATFIRRRFPEETSDRLRRIRWWDWPHELVLQHSARISSGTPESLDVLEQVANELWKPVAAPLGFVDSFVRSTRHRVRVRALAAPKPGLPALLVLHGSFGSIDTVFALAPQLLDTCNPVFCDLPGFGQSLRPTKVELPAYVEAMEDVLDALKIDVFDACGASFGGAVALGLAARRAGCRRVALLDMPLTAQKLWHNQQFLRKLMTARPDSGFIREFAFNIYGTLPALAVERSYWGLLDAVKVPVVMAVGDVPMMPPREFTRVPVCVDDGDIQRLERDHRVRVVRMAGGHDLANENTPAVVQLLREMLAS